MEEKSGFSKHRSSISDGPLPVSRTSNAAILPSSTPLTNSARSPPPAKPPRNIVVIFDASRAVSIGAVEWAVERIVCSRDALTQLGILPAVNSASALTGIAKLMRYKPQRGMEPGQAAPEEEISRKLRPLLSDIQRICEEKNVKFKLNIVCGHPLSAAAVNEVRKLQPSWVILDRNMKRHSNYIHEHVSCNLVLVDHKNEGRILNLTAPVVLGPSLKFQEICSELDGGSGRIPRVSSLGGESDSPADAIPSRNKHDQAWTLKRSQQEASPVLVNAERETSFSYDQTSREEGTITVEAEDSGSIFSCKSALSSLLCSVCKHRSHDLKKHTREFSYSELEEATDNFSSVNFLAEGGFGSVYRGVLRDGQLIAVKQQKPASIQGEKELCAEIKVLRGAQHRNLVTLLGPCVENGKRILVYEFVCNKSLGYHLFNKSSVLPWSARLKIALGAARALRYLHEECKVGTIIHRDLRPHNILLTHDYNPLVGDFGLARWHAKDEPAVETKVIGTLGYLAPEYAATGQVTEKTDVYSFGMILLEMVTGRRALDMSLPIREQSLLEWARPKLNVRDVESLIDPRLPKEQLQGSNLYEIQAMVHAAASCLRREPSQRPRMSQVLRILEGERSEGLSPSLNLYSTSDRSVRIPRVPSGNILSRSPGKGLLSYEEMIS